MTTTTTKKRTVKPVTMAGVRIIKMPHYRGENEPAGRSGLVEFSGSIYSILPLGASSRDGYRLTNLDNQKVYDVDTSSGQPTCDCGDFTWRRRPCKHCLALVELRKKRTI